MIRVRTYGFPGFFYEANPGPRLAIPRRSSFTSNPKRPLCAFNCRAGAKRAKRAGNGACVRVAVFTVAQIGFTLSTEEFGPHELVGYAAKAEEAGFDFLSISDHFHPWVDSQGNSPFVWAVLGAVAEATEKIRVGTGVTCPTTRIHPAIIAQARRRRRRCCPAASGSASAPART